MFDDLFNKMLKTQIMILQKSVNIVTTKTIQFLSWLQTWYNILLVLQYIPVHPGLHSKHVPFNIWHMLFLQLAGHDKLQ